MRREANRRRQLENQVEIEMAVVTYDFTTWVSPAFAALTPAMGQVYFDTATVSILRSRDRRCSLRART
jgi:hypothetical protein